MTRKIQVHHYPSAAGAAREALLFVHGAYVDSRCWEYNFVPFFQRRGYDCFAVDLSGHGASEGKERIHEFGIDDYADDVANALQRIGRPATVVGHSMGARVLERFLERGLARSAVFLAPVPPTGTAGSAMQLALRHPSFFEALECAVNGRFSGGVAELMTKIYFSPDMSTAEALTFLPMVGTESDRAVAEMAVVRMGRPVGRGKLPALVIGGSDDLVFPPSMLHFCALPWDADVYRVEGAGHMLMLDPQWELAARRMLAWLGREETVAAG